MVMNTEITLPEALEAIRKIPLKKVLSGGVRRDVCQICGATGFPSEHAVLFKGEAVGERRLIAHERACVWARVKRTPALTS